MKYHIFFSLLGLLISPQGAYAQQEKIEDPKYVITFPTERIRIGGRVLTVEVADSDERRARGLMFRKELAPDKGMLFVFPRAQVLRFWMRKTLIPLSIGFFDHRRRLLVVREMSPASDLELSPPTFSSEKPAMYALEMPSGWFAKNKTAPGMTFSRLP